MKNNKIILDDEYFIEIDSLNWILKKKRASKNRILGYFSRLDDAFKRYIDENAKEVFSERSDELPINEVIELLHQIESRLNHALGTLKTQLKEED